ncbi:MAG: flavin reductase family protein [Planctomycetaceae bacterium]
MARKSSSSVESSGESSGEVAPVLGRIPSGAFILVVGDGNGRTTGMLASWVQQASFDPPQVTVAVNKSRFLTDWLSDDSPVTINQVPKPDAGLFKHFGRGFEPGVDAFSGVPTMPGENGLPLLTNSLASLEGIVADKLESGDHLIYLITITSARSHQPLDSTEPYVHIRKNGLNY